MNKLTFNELVALLSDHDAGWPPEDDSDLWEKDPYWRIISDAAEYAEEDDDPAHQPSDQIRAMRNMLGSWAGMLRQADELLRNHQLEYEVKEGTE